MISITEAKTIIQDSVRPTAPAELSLHQAAGLVLAADVFAMADIPAYPQSAMDGYAFSFEGWNRHKELLIEGEMAAGSNRVVEVEPQKAVRIFTGAAIPPGADTVVMQEKVQVENNKLIIEDRQLQQGLNVRPPASEIKAGELALQKGMRLTPAAMGFLAGIGTTTVSAYPAPSVAIIITGNELQQPGRQLEYGKVYESNSFALKAALQQLQIQNVNVHWVKDDPDTLTATLQQALNENDAVLLTGGISVGDYDFVLQAANSCQVEQLFYKVRQKPGKPLYFGKRQEQLVFGLPGNPSSVMTCFYLYVLPALRQLGGQASGLYTVQAPIAEGYQKAAGMTHFLKGYFDGQTARYLGAQESYRMRSFAQANCLIQIDEDQSACKSGTLVTTHLLPF
ncbi:molybdopterin molybdotransferase MoeA [Flavisolibacter nicotianae]|uniref:molybdopterin molybdotransferase MoeA n=1 Tax=Flavisolibacter nicotianae TaxID=2364882 RepID=UPI000EACF616|nr:gephyrin-like molybdotransferase Glp [Flavisolibacter nicotianae]